MQSNSGEIKWFGNKGMHSWRSQVKTEAIQVYEDFWKAMVELWKENREKVKELRAQNKYAILIYNKIYTTGKFVI